MPQLSRSFRSALTLGALSGVLALGAASGASGAKAGPHVGSPDLLLRDVMVDWTDDGLAVEGDVVNAGSRRARRSDVVFAISTDESFDDEDEILDERSVRRVSPRQTRPIDTDLELTDDLPEGSVYLLVCADGYGVVRERRETNNCIAELISEDASGDPQADDGADEDDDPYGDESGAEDGSDQAPAPADV